MAIRKQVYEWELLGRDLFVPADYPNAGQEYSIFTSSYGTAINDTSLVSEDEFVVIDRISCRPGVSPNEFEVDGTTLKKWNPNMFIQFVVDTTGYYRDPQNVYSAGISGMASPYPQRAFRMNYYDLWPPIYVLPDQTWDVRFTLYNDLRAAHANGLFDRIKSDLILAQVFVDYTLFDGTDAILARKLLSLGVPVSTQTVQWLRQLILQNRGLNTETYDFYLKAQREITKRDKEKRKLQGLATVSDYGE